MRTSIRFAVLGTIIALMSVVWFGRNAALARDPNGTQAVNNATFDVGDAPDSTNHIGVSMNAYPSIQAKFPTVYDVSTGYPPGPSHITPNAVFLGLAVTLEDDADVGVDNDGVTNLDPAADLPDRDKAEDGFVGGPPNVSSFQHCQPTTLKVLVTVNTMVADQLFLNLWFDWTHNGQWGESQQCPGGLSNEWAVQNQTLTFSGPGTYTFTTNAFLPAASATGAPEPIWLRMSLSDTPASNADGRGPDNRWHYGETEDYLLSADPTVPTATAPPSDVISDLGDAPDSSNSFGMAMDAYPSVIARYPTVFSAGGPPPGPLHHNISLFNLGPNVTAEQEADTGGDVDPTNNILPNTNTPNKDLMDDGLVSQTSLSGYPHCQLTNVTYTVMYNGSTPREVFFNLWTDWNRNGAWGDVFQCPGALSNEWAVQNQIIMLNPGLNTFTSPSFFPFNPATALPMSWFRLTVSESAASDPDGRGPANGWQFGETEDLLMRVTQTEPTFTPTPTKEPTATSTPFVEPTFTPTITPTNTPTKEPTATATHPPQEPISDLGDAPDSSNSFGPLMDAYTAVTARFPTVYGPGSPPHGPLHLDARVFHLGQSVTFEREADTGPDMDPSNNILPNINTPNRDLADNGLISPTNVSGFPMCQPVKLTYSVMNTGPTRQVYFNSWADWTRNGAWGEQPQCSNGLADEWIVQNQIITLNPGMNIFTSPAFLPWHPLGTNIHHFWLRLTVSDTPASNNDGRGPAGGWKLGETEDFLIPDAPIEPTLTPTPKPTLTPTPTKEPTPNPEARYDLGDAPDSTNSFGAMMNAYTGVTARFPSVFTAGGPPPGPLHLDINLFYLGRKVTAEREADSLLDTDTFNNIEPSSDRNNQDRADDGLVRPRTLADLPNCQLTPLTYTVTYNGTMPRQVYFNAWFDWTRNGAWGEQPQCANGLAKEWAVQNQVITLNPGLNTFTSPTFLPFHPKDRAALWFRMTVSDAPAPANDGRGPNSGWKFGETEDYFLSPDLGDAPDSHNSMLVPMPAYSWWFWPLGRFPTVYNRLPTFLPNGPLHQNLTLPYMLGKTLSAEREADSGPDSDGVNNLVLWPQSPNRDKADDAFVSVPTINSLKHCQFRTLNYQVTVPNNQVLVGTNQAYVNVWIDWNRGGTWGGTRPCKFGWFWLPSNEWAVQNQLITLGAPGVYNFTTPAFLPYQPNGLQPAWLRITISDTPATAMDGRGPVGGWAFGETEDFLLRPTIIHHDIIGTVKEFNGPALAGAEVLLISRTEHLSSTLPYQVLQRTYTQPDGTYRFTDLPAGSYFVEARNQGYLDQWYNHKPSMTTADPVVITTASASNIDFDLRRRPLHPVTLDGPVATSYNPDGTFFATVFQPGQVTATIDPTCMTCPNGATPSNPQMILTGVSAPIGPYTYPVTLGPNGYTATIPAADLSAIWTNNRGAVLKLTLVWDCNGLMQQREVGHLMLHDPSGIITDSKTGDPVVGAHVQLFHVPGWEAKTSPQDDSVNSCQSNLSKAVGAPWDQPAPVEEGILADNAINLFAPNINTQITGSDGRYAWDVDAGCWYVVVTADGYSTKVSPVVGVPTAVTDLDLELTRAQYQLFIPTVQK